MKFTFFLTLLFFFQLLPAQTSSDAEADNIIPNPSFELYSAPPIGWFYKGEHYTNVMKYWSSATNASPDVFGPKVRVPAHWAEKGFGKQIPRTGLSMSGITVYGCNEGKPHCREYIEIQLSEPLITGQDYLAEMWVSHLPKSLLVNNLGFYFSKEKIEEITDGVLRFNPQVFAEDVIGAKNNRWAKVAGRFTAASEAEYLVIGNFFPDSLTITQPGPEGSLPYAYYYIEDVLVKKIPPILPIPIREDDLTKVKLEAGKVVPLRDIYFEHDKWELMPRSFVELKKLLKIMRNNPQLAIEVCGHTDSTGEDEYNRSLSEKRARSVVDYLIANGIPDSRTRYRGCGSAQPIATNATPQGRQMNRRVEFIVLQNE
ncbi:MAG: OmpA family protein [Lewinellaceae bacterium]|nr:OmpA family protein [Saprospiraceae bacterium]MCB9338422.1 OmpA family protein [Lewinellaceae bacterium]